jgi:hypothetical protein
VHYWNEDSNMSTTSKDTNEAEVWSAIRYLDPDEVAKGRMGNDRVSKIATVMTLFVFVIIMVVWVMLCFRGL